jgi:methylated-DNA-[protein]-cysteine S-methyltransferase
MLYTKIESPVGPLLLAGDERGLCQLQFFAGRRKTAVPREWEREDSAFREAIRQLRAYFAGERKEFDLTLAPEGTPFQLVVWKNLRKIPYGETISYGQLARRIGRPQAARAVGLANGSNPIAIIIPCHRVIGANGTLTGYGGGLPIKEKLLALESRQLALL